MANLKVISVEYSGRDFYFQSPVLTDGVNIIQGRNGTGKTTFVHLIYYALGGNVEEFDQEEHKHVEVFGDADNYVLLTIAINGREHKVKRYVKDRSIAVIDGDQVVTYPIGRSGEKETFSDWILKRLGIEVFSVSMGSYEWKISFMDLIRLIYYDQNPYLGDIYKRPDYTPNFVNDSVVIRKAVFEILIGYSSVSYYKAYNALRELEKRREIARGTLDSFSAIASVIKEKNRWQDSNTVFLARKKTELSQILERLLAEVEQAKAVPVAPDKRTGDIESLKTELVVLEKRRIDLQSQLFGQNRDAREIDRVYLETQKEIHNLQRIIYTHDKLDAFHGDTCPICLRQYPKKEGKCICGNDLPEDEMATVFFETHEYMDMLRSRTKSLDTIRKAKESSARRISQLERDLSETANRVDETGRGIEERIQQYNGMYDNAQLVEDTLRIMSVREQLADVEQQSQIEAKLAAYQKEYDHLTEQHSTQKQLVSKMQIELTMEITNKRKTFGQIYNDYMMSTLQGCRSAYINQDYHPVINGGTYTENSAVVPTRLMYYLALLRLSLSDESVVFPRLLIVDTPDTAGIDEDALKANLKQMADIPALGKPFQILLTTGIGVYPKELASAVRLTLSDEEKLLHRRSDPRSKDTSGPSGSAGGAPSPKGR